MKRVKLNRKKVKRDPIRPAVGRYLKWKDGKGNYHKHLIVSTEDNSLIGLESSSGMRLKIGRLANFVVTLN